VRSINDIIIRLISKFNGSGYSDATAAAKKLDAQVQRLGKTAGNVGRGVGGEVGKILGLVGSGGVIALAAKGATVVLNKFQQALEANKKATEELERATERWQERLASIGRTARLRELAEDLSRIQAGVSSTASRADGAQHQADLRALGRRSTGAAGSARDNVANLSDALEARRERARALYEARQQATREAAKMERRLGANANQRENEAIRAAADQLAKTAESYNQKWLAEIRGIELDEARLKNARADLDAAIRADAEAYEIESRKRREAIRAGVAAGVSALRDWAKKAAASAREDLERQRADAVRRLAGLPGAAVPAADPAQSVREWMRADRQTAIDIRREARERDYLRRRMDRLAGREGSLNRRSREELDRLRRFFGEDAAAKKAAAERAAAVKHLESIDKQLAAAMRVN